MVTLEKNNNLLFEKLESHKILEYHEELRKEKEELKIEKWNSSNQSS
jgi:hypothetical protein